MKVEKILVSIVSIIAVVILAACAPAPVVPTPVPPTATPVLITPTPRPQDFIQADWEEMFRTMNTYEYVSTQGQPSKKAWWIEQANRFYTGEALTKRLEQIDFMFSPRSGGMTPGFIEKAQYTVAIDNCMSDTECVLKAHIQSGAFWAYNLPYKSWGKANEVEPVDWTISMQYDAAAGRWKINK